jgi:transcriptional regulator with XRE-family HTH domain
MTQEAPVLSFRDMNRVSVAGRCPLTSLSKLPPPEIRDVGERGHRPFNGCPIRAVEVNMNEIESTTDKHPVTEARESLGLTRSQLALACGISYYTLSQVESGLIRSIPKPLKKMFGQAGLDTGALDLLVAIWLEQQSRQFAGRILSSMQPLSSSEETMVRQTELYAIIKSLEGLQPTTSHKVDGGA